MEASSALPMDQGYVAGTNDSALVRAAQIDPDAFGELYNRYFTPVYRYLRSCVVSEEDAADLTQQVFLQALRGLPSYDERKASFRTWLFRIARHAATDAFRRRRSSTSWEALPEMLRGIALDDPEEAALRRESQARLQDLLAGLNSDKRELLWLRFVVELEVQEIAAVVGKSPAAVTKGIFRTLRTLEEEYRER